MSSNTRIVLPVHATSRRVLDLLAKIAGTPYKIEKLGKDQYDYNSFGNRKARVMDPSQPASEFNSWHVDFGDKIKASHGHSSYDLSNGYLHFEDFSGEKHAWMMFVENGDEEGTHALLPGSNALATAIGIRLVNFFGGFVHFDDGTDEDIKGNALRVSLSRAKFPKKKKEQSSNDRWYQFQNLLANEPLVSVEELEWANGKVAYTQHKLSLKLLERLKIEEQRKHLDRNSQPAVGVARKSRRL